MKYRVYGIATASHFIAEVEADSKADAVTKAYEISEDVPCLCHQCAEDIELGDWYGEQVEEVKE